MLLSELSRKETNIEERKNTIYAAQGRNLVTLKATSKHGFLTSLD